MRKLLFISLLSLCISGCQHTSIRDVLKGVTEQQVDTTGFDKRTIRTTSFNAIEINCFADITYHQTSPGTNEYVELQAPTEVLKHLRYKVSDDGKLCIEQEYPYEMPKHVAAVIHVYAPMVNDFVVSGGKCLRLGKMVKNAPVNIRLNGIGAITCSQLHAPGITILLNGAGNMDFKNINTQKLNAQINGAGNIYLEGKALDTHTSINGAGTIDTTKLHK